MSEQGHNGHDNGHAKDYKTAVIEELEKGQQRARKLGWDVTEVYRNTLSSSEHVAKDKDGAPIFASIMGNEEALGKDFVKTYMSTMQGRYSFNDRFTEEYDSKLMQFFTGASGEQWIDHWRKQGPNMGYAEIAKPAEKYMKTLVEEGQQKAQNILVPMLLKTSSRHKLVKDAGLEDMIGTEDEPVLPEQIIGPALQGILSDQNRYKSTIAHMYGLSHGSDEHH